MVNVYLNLSIFTVFLKNKNIILKIRRSKVTDYAALNLNMYVWLRVIFGIRLHPYIFLFASNKDSDKTAQMRRLVSIWTFKW